MENFIFVLLAFLVTMSELAAKSSFVFVVILMNRHNKLNSEIERVDI